MASSSPGAAKAATSHCAAFLMKTTLVLMNKIQTMAFADVYPHYVAKVERKGRTVEQLHEIIQWLTGFDESAIRQHIDQKSTFPEFFAAATLNPNAHQIKGVICGVRVEDMTDPLMQKVRYLDKLVDELARGKAMDKILRS